jgi:hypothetical protein
MQVQPSSHPLIRMSKRLSDIFDMIGGGSPTEIHQVAKHMAPLEYRRLVSLVRQKDGDTKCRSRAELLVKQKEVSDEISKAAICRDFQKAQELQVLYDDLEIQKSDFPDIAELQRQFDEETYRIELAVSAKDWAKAQRLQSELDTLDTAIRMESDVENTINEHDAEVLQTRASLEAKLLQLEDDYQKACDVNNFSKAREIDAESEGLKSARSQKPSRADYAMKANVLKGELENAKAKRNLDAAEMIYKRLVEVKAKLKLEEEAEAALGIRVGSRDNKQEGKAITPAQLRQGTSRTESQQSASSETQSSIATAQSSDPPGSLGISPVHFTEDTHSIRQSRRETQENEKRKAQPRQASAETQNLDEDYSDEDYSVEKPGAIRMGGIDSGDEIDNIDDESDMNADQDTAKQPVQALQSESENYVAKAELVQEQLDLERVILDTLRKNMVEAVDVTKTEEKEKKGFGQFLKKWGKKKK